MSFLGKLKPRGPPAPPRRTDNNAAFEWPQDEFDDEDGDMYEVPPCERQPVKVPQTQIQENIYLERASRPEIHSPPRLSKPSTPQSTVKPPEINRTEKPGRKKMPDPPARSAPAPAPLPEEDVYLDPNEEQEDNDDVYLEPEPSCPSPAPKRGPKPPPPKPMVKPPVPRAETQPMFSAIHELKTSEDRRASFPGQLTQRVLPPDLKEPKPMLPHPLMGDYKPGGGSRMTKQSGNEDKEWFAGDCSRQTAENLLNRVRKDGAFLIRYSSDKRPQQPYTLAVLYQQKVYNIPIRFIEESKGYALGKEGKKNEEVFSSLDEMISYHKNNQILLIDSKSQAKHTAHLTQPVRP
ncbi:SH2 domain-containing protein 6-like [Xiphophorus maculatus]|uniref:SH2 domain-containing protein 6-like n=1 Tax=Xiphophorus maculatus TaxID=8083 RepID=A0A3B5RAG6_XIPMA|nr:SH2 domain-containing protein 6-like [Xiphophorus maculatus]